MPKQIVLVGHCGIDGPRLQKEISAKIKDVNVTRVNTEEGLTRATESPDSVLLVNREPVGFKRDGLEIIRTLRESNGNAKVMLVSDHDDAQQEAKQLGAVRGFGKAEIGSSSLIDRINEAFAGG